MQLQIFLMPGLCVIGSSSGLWRPLYLLPLAKRLQRQCRKRSSDGYERL